MPVRIVVVSLLIFLSALNAAVPLTEKFAKRVAGIEDNYALAIKKADNAKAIAVQKASAERIRALRSLMSEATKAGDFETAAPLREKIAAADKDATKDLRPNDQVSFAGNSYAVVREKSSWYRAKLRCEEMGGHLAVIDTPSKRAFIIKECAKYGESAWLGAFNEDGYWEWVTGGRVASTDGWTLNDGSQSTGLAYWHDTATLDDYSVGGRLAYVCEWD